MQNDAGITVLIPTPLRRFTDGNAKVIVAGSSVGEVLDALDATHPESANDSGTIPGSFAGS